jgi:DNA-binding Lrp family transcriptional regulator
MTLSATIDRVALRIAAALQRDGRQSAQQLADSVGLSATPVWRRVKELEAGGVIRGYVALLDREKLGLSICVLAHVTLVRHSEGASSSSRRWPSPAPRSWNATARRVKATT